MDKKRASAKFTTLILVIIQANSNMGRRKVEAGSITQTEIITMANGKMINLMESANTTPQKEENMKASGNRRRDTARDDKLGLMAPFSKEPTSSIKRQVGSFIIIMGSFM